MPTGLSPVSRQRVIAAFVVALVTDAAQLLLGPLGWVGMDQALDLVAMILITALIGFHPLLLPSFFLELVPVADLLPTWTICVAMVVGFKLKPKTTGAASPEIKGARVIDV
jgi:hypothetical protein